MTGPSCYRFATPAQKRACLTTGLAETLLLGPAGGEAVPGLTESGIRLVAAAPDGELFSIDGNGRLCAGGECGPAIANARRLAVGRDSLWVLADDGLHRFDRSTLQRLLTRDSGGAIDIAAAANGGYWRLRRARIDLFSADGRRTGKALRARRAARAIAVVGDTIFLLSDDSERLELLSIGDGRSVEIDLSRLLESAGAGFGAGPDGFGEAELVQGQGRMLLRRKRRDGWPEYLVLDAEGSVTARGRGEDGRPIRAIALAGDDLIAALGDGGALLRFAGAAAGGGARWLTPALETGSHGEGWLRAEVLARLPEGATLSLRWAALPDEALRRSVEALQADRSLAAGDLLAATAELLGPYWSPEYSYTGQPDEDGADAVARRLDFPLEKDAGQFLWIYLKLRRNDAIRAPAIDSLTVHHGTERLIDHLPAIYRGDGDGDGTLRRLVGVMEATTHGIDRTIAGLAARLDPDRTEDRWLPGLAAMLGLPFDDALTPDMQRRLIGAAGALLVGRGTRGGLAALFEALFPDRTVRILDRSTQFIPVALGGPGFAGGRLPALLTGPTRRMPALNARLVLGGTPLSRPEGDGLIAPMPEVLVSIPATGGERRRFEAAVRQMAEAMVPAGVRLRLRWLPWRRRPSGSPGDWLAVVDDPPPLGLGDGRLGRAALGGRRDPKAESTPLGPTGHRLL
jgi:phage tail-like protein